MDTLKVVEPFVCGGISGCIASTFIHPIDLSKVRLQLFATQNPGMKKPPFYTILADMIKKDGVASIYSGITAAYGRQCVYGTARIGLFRTISDYITKVNGGKPLSILEKIAAGLSSGAVAVCAGTPFDVALVRMQADSMKPLEQRRGYKNAFSAVARIAKEEGVLALYRYQRLFI